MLALFNSLPKDSHSSNQSINQSINLYFKITADRTQQGNREKLKKDNIEKTS